MTDQVQTMGYGTALQGAERNKVLRNTYILLSLSMIPTVLGAYVGVQTGLFRMFGGILGFVLFFAVAMGFMWGINKTKNSGMGVVLLLAFTFFMGVVLSGLISRVLGFSNGPSLIMTAFGGTAGVFAVMAMLATVIKRDLSGMAKYLFVGVIVVLIASVINIFVGSSTMMLVLSTAVVGIFSLYMLYDLKQIMDGGETNYVSATLALYLDIFNVFQGLLSILGLTSGSND
jgi:modulator of FtsH protease